MDEITPHADWLALGNQREALLSQLAVLVTELHAMDDARPVILGRYAAAFGTRLTALHGLEIEAARLKREIELIQAALNSGAEIDFDRIQSILDEEFAEWQTKLEKEAAQLAAYRDVPGDLQDPELTKQLREKFRILARRLHPDLHPDQSAAEAALWHRVTAAYERSDLDELSTLEIITSDAPDAPMADSIEVLRDHVAALRVRMDELVLAIDERGKEWPFDQLVILDDPHAVAAKQEELDSRIQEAIIVRDQRKHWLSTLLDHPAP
jgi:hypothetical protein